MRAKSQQYRKANPKHFKCVGGVYMGYRKGVMNGPKPTTERGRRRAKARKRGAS